MKIGPVGIAGNLDELVPPRHDRIQALEQGINDVTNMAPS